MDDSIVLGRKLRTHKYRNLKRSLKINSISVRSALIFILKHKKKSVFYIIVLSLCFLGISRLYRDIESNIESFITHADSENIETANEISFHDAKVKFNTNIATNTQFSDSKLAANANLVDKRVIIFDEYFRVNNSPLYGTANLFVAACDKYGAPRDCITVVAIAKNETDLCKYHISAQMKNCWGFGGAGIYRITFNSWEQAIDRVYDVLVNQYGVEYMLDPTKMEKTFCGTEDPACENWGNKIKTFMRQIDDFSAGTGLGRLTEMR